MVYKVKFFGTKVPRKQIEKVAMEVEANSRADVRKILEQRYGYCVINGLKIR